MKRTTLNAGRPMDERVAVPGLRGRRVRSGMSAAQLCVEIRKCAAVNPATLLGWEVGRTRPSAAVVKCLASALGCRVGDLYGRGEGR